MANNKSKFFSSIVDIAHFGFRDWVAQRISAIILAIYTMSYMIEVWLSVYIKPHTHQERLFFAKTRARNGENFFM